MNCDFVKIPTYVIIMEYVCGTKLYIPTLQAVTVILVGNYLIIESVPRERSIASSMRLESKTLGE